MAYIYNGAKRIGTLHSTPSACKNYEVFWYDESGHYNSERVNSSEEALSVIG